MIVDIIVYYFIIGAWVSAPISWTMTRWWINMMANVAKIKVRFHVVLPLYFIVNMVIWPIMLFIAIFRVEAIQEALFQAASELKTELKDQK